MKFSIFLISFIVVFAPSSLAVPMTMNYQGHVESGGMPFDGTGLFMFAIVNGDGTATYWSNDGTTGTGVDPTLEVEVGVNNGLFSVILGDTNLTNMVALDSAVFDNDELKIRIWFNNGSPTGTQLLSPDQWITTQGFAFRAGTADDALAVSGQSYSSSWNTTEANIQTALSNDFHTIGGVDAVDDADADPTNELNTSLTLNGSVLELTDGAKNTVQEDLSPLFSELGDGHSLDSADGGFEDVVFVDADGNVSVDSDGLIVMEEVWTGIQSIPDVGWSDGDCGYPGSAGVLLEIEGSDLVEKVEIELSIQHTYDADLNIWVVSPEGTLVCLSDDNGGPDDNYTNTVFDDDADISIVDGSAPFTGRYRPEVSLAEFAGEDPNGVWLLRVLDDQIEDIGNIRLFKVKVFFRHVPDLVVSGTITASDLDVSGTVTASNLDVLGTVTSGVIISNDPGTSPAGSSVQFNSPSTHPGIIMERGDGTGEVDQRWDLLIDDNDFFRIYDKTHSLDSMTINTTGYVGIGTANPLRSFDVSGSRSGDAIASIQNTFNDGYGCDGLLIEAGADMFLGLNHLIAFRRPDDTVLGNIDQNGTSTVAYNTSSDRRIKTGIKNTRYALSDLMRIKVVDYTFKGAPEDVQTGFIAQQLYTWFPVAVSPGGEDPKTDPWMVDYSRLTPLLVKSLQELANRTAFIEEELGLDTLSDEEQVTESLENDVENSVLSDRIEDLEAENAALKTENTEIRALIRELQDRMNILEGSKP